MRVVAISSSARSGGNTARCLQLALRNLQQFGYEGQFIELSTHKILPCQGCNVECFQHGAACPLLSKDEVQTLWTEIRSASAIIWGIPNYSNGLPGLLKCFIDRFRPLEYNSTLTIPKLCTILVFGEDQLEFVKEQALASLSFNDQVIDCLLIDDFEHAATQPVTRNAIFAMTEKIDKCIKKKMRL